MINTAEVPGFGGAYRISSSGREVFRDYQLLAPEDGYYALSHPDSPEIVTLLRADELHGVAYGQPIPGLQEYTFNRVTTTVYDNAGAAVPVITVPTKSWGKSEEPAVRHHHLDGDEETSTVYTVADLMKGAGPGARTPVPGGYMPGYYDDEDDDDDYE